MTPYQIAAWRRRIWFNQNSSEVKTTAALLEIALQLSRLNAHNARMEARYMELTKTAVRNQRAKGKGQKAKVSKAAKARAAIHAIDPDDE